MPLIYQNGLSIFFAHVPKTGGSSIEDYLIRRFGSLAIREQRTDSVLGGRKRDIIQSVSHLSAADLECLLPKHLDYCFTVVRDPLERIVSEYRFQTGVSRMSRLGFSIWLRVMLTAARKDPRIYENHIRPQVDLVPENAEIFHLEDGFDRLIAQLDQVTGCEAPSISVKHLLKRPRTQIALSKQDVALITKFYRDDYDRFSYMRPVPEAFSGDLLAASRDFLAWFLAQLVIFKHRLVWFG